MANSVKSWDSLNEALGRAKEIMYFEGRKYGAKMKIQSNTKFLIKLFSPTTSIDDTSGNLTSKGANAIAQFINNNPALVKTFGKIDAAFFQKWVLIYTIVRQNNRFTKIQFTLVDRSTVEGLAPTAQFVSTNALKELAHQDEMLHDVVTDNQNTAGSDDTEGDPEQPADGSESDGKGSEITQAASGSRFRYSMRANSKTYMMTFEVSGSIDAQPISPGDKEPSGVISWDGKEPVWLTDLDDGGNVKNEVLYTDGPLAHATDIKFFKRIFTEQDFLDNVIQEYEEKYGSSEINGENLKGMLYHIDGTKIFPDRATATGADDTSKYIHGETGHVSTQGAMHKFQ